jgi:hypothetical protein
MGYYDDKTALNLGHLTTCRLSERSFQKFPKNA